MAWVEKAEVASATTLKVKERASLVAQTVRNPPANAGDSGSIPGLGRSSGGGNDNPLQYSCLENSMDRGTWRATVHEATESDMTK